MPKWDNDSGEILVLGSGSQSALQDRQQQYHLGTFRNANFQAPPQTHCIRNLGVGPSSLFEQAIQGIMVLPQMNRCFPSQVYHLEAV